MRATGHPSSRCHFSPIRLRSRTVASGSIQPPSYIRAEPVSSASHELSTVPYGARVVACLMLCDSTRTALIRAEVEPMSLKSPCDNASFHAWPRRSSVVASMYLVDSMKQQHLIACSRRWHDLIMLLMRALRLRRDRATIPTHQPHIATSHVRSSIKPLSCF